MQIHATCESFFLPTMILTHNFKVIVTSIFPLQNFLWLEMDMLLYLLCPKFLKVMTIIQSKEWLKVGNREAPKVCCHS
jgi:hypothetical protein